MDEEAEKRLLRFEDKMDRINERINAFPVVGQRINDVERRLSHIEANLHELQLSVNENRMGVGRILLMMGIVGTGGAIIVREFIGRLGA